MSWIRKANILIFLGVLFVTHTNAQEKLLPLSKLASCKVYVMPAEDSLKNSDAYKHPEKIYAISYTFNFGRSKKERWDDLPFTAKEFPNLQFLVLNNFYPLPANLGSFEKLQVLFVNNNQDGIYQEDTYADRLGNRPKFISQNFYSLFNLKIFYTNNLPPYSYNDYPMTAFYFDIEKLKGMKSLQLIDLPDGLMDDKIIPAFFAPQLKVLINSDNQYLFMGAFDKAIRNLEEQKLDPKISEELIQFSRSSKDVLFVNNETHEQGYFKGKDKVDLNKPVSNKILLKNYIKYLGQAENIKKENTTLKNEFNIYNSNYFGYTANLVEIQDDKFPGLDTTEFRKNKLYARHTGFVKYKVEQKITVYYFPKTGSYILKTTYYNGLESYRVDVKWYSVLTDNKIQIKWVEEIDENFTYYDYEKTKTYLIQHNYKLEEKFNKEITLK